MRLVDIISPIASFFDFTHAAWFFMSLVDGVGLVSLGARVIHASHSHCRSPSGEHGDHNHSNFVRGA